MRAIHDFYKFEGIRNIEKELHFSVLIGWAIVHTRSQLKHKYLS